MEEQKSYIKVAFAPDLAGRDRVIYRALEMVPGIIAWTTLVGIVAASYWVPVWAAFFIIIFDVYWLVKTIFLSFHLRANLDRMQMHIETDWSLRLTNLRHEHLWQLVILPMSKEPLDVVRETV
ncbi:MAG TPA: hypothetical protein VJH89_03310, partial [Patescibacteria group bacterium]|nr:hypothetical protein [Patescibacteria group bacterium]